MATDSDLTAFGRDLGAGTALPTQGPAASALRRGDVYQHNGFGCLFVYNGTGWRQVTTPGIDPAGTAPTTYASALHYGFRTFFGGVEWTWDGTRWIGPNPRVTANMTVSPSVTGQATTALPWASITPRSTAAMWSATNPTRLVALEAGEYDLSTALEWNVSANPGGLVAGYRLNGVGLAWVESRATQIYYDTWVAFMVKGLVLAVGDYIEVMVLQNSDTNRSIKAGATATLELARR